jgi:heme-degrading monooxygenase HmoA
MYGTVARIRLKPGKEAEMMELSRHFENRRIRGHVADFVYRMDADPNQYYLVTVWESKDAYFANANSPEQDADYRRMLELLESPPEWHDGEIVYSFGTAQHR